MAETMVLTKTRLRSGVWEGVLTGATSDQPVLTLRHNGAVLSGLSVEPTPDGTWQVRAQIPVERISDDLQIFTITADDDTTILAHFTVFAGEIDDDDLRAEVALLRAELDLLKRAFRKHCSDTM